MPLINRHDEVVENSTWLLYVDPDENYYAFNKETANLFICEDPFPIRSKDEAEEFDICEWNQHTEIIGLGYIVANKIQGRLL